MSINRAVHGDEVGRVLEIAITLDGGDCVPGDKWTITATGVAFTPGEQEIPAGATSHTLTWQTAAPLCGNHPNPLVVELKKSGAAVSAQSFTVPIRARATIQVEHTGNVQMDNLVQRGPWVLILISIVGFLVAIAGVVFLLWLFSGQAATGFNSQGAIPPGISSIPAGASVVVTSVNQTVVSGDPAVLQTAVKGSASITHPP